MLVGIQGSGKGTQARKLIDAFGYKLFDAGAELRKMAKNDTDLGRKIHHFISNGLQVPAEFLRETISTFMKKNTGNPILFDGPIRSKEQDEVIRPILGKCLIIDLVLDPNLAIERILRRRIDPETGETFPADFPLSTNPKTGNTLIKRDDDQEEIIKNRIKWSIEESLPLIEVWKKDGYDVHHIDANRDMETIFKEITNIII